LAGAVTDTDAELLLVALVELVAGQEEASAQYEDEVLALLPRHGGSLERRLTTGDTEVQVIRFAGRAGLEAFRQDPDRLALRDRFGAAVPATRVLEVTPR
jgi:hypothetical protein